MSERPQVKPQTTARLTDDQFDAMHRAICQETCAFMGEPACWQVVPNEWPNPNCDEPGCHALALAAAFALGDHSRGVCPVCGGDCAAANPPVTFCPMKETV